MSHGLSTTTTSHAPSYSSLTGTGTLLRFMLRRDRIRTLAWVAGIGVMGFYFAQAVQVIAEDQESLASLAGLYADPVGRMMIGPGYGMDAPTFERFFASGYALYIYLLIALCSVFTVVRHTRAEEQTGRAELVRANMVGRHATLTSAVLLTTAINGVAAVLVWVAALTAGYAMHGSLLVAAGGLAVGLFFMGAAAVAAQLTESSRGASAFAGGLLGLAFVVRMAGDMAEFGGSTLSWFSPLAWAQQTAPFVYDRWWPLLFLVAGAVVFTALGFWLSTRRDLGASLMPTRLGRREAQPWLGTPLGLATHTLRGGLRGWGIALVLVAFMFGSYAQTMLEAGDSLPAELSQIFAGEDLMVGYMSYMALFIAVFVAAASVSSLQQIRGEEHRGRAEYALSVPMHRITWFGAHLAVVIVGVFVMLALVGLAMGVGAVLTVEHDAGQYFGQLFVASVMQAPAVLATVGIVTLLLGWLPRAAAGIGWLFVGFAAVMSTFGGLLELPQFVIDLNVFGHLAEYPVEDIAWAPVVILTAIGVATLLVGLVGFNRRELNRV